MAVVQVAPKLRDAPDELLARPRAGGDPGGAVGGRAAVHVEVVAGAAVAPAEDDGRPQVGPPTPVERIRDAAPSASLKGPFQENATVPLCASWLVVCVTYPARMST
jgi:hypothetical protein